MWEERFISICAEVELMDERLMSLPFEEKVGKSKEVIRQAVEKYGENLAVAWTGGKDSTALLHMIRSVYGRVPVRVLFGDTGVHFQEVYDFRDRLAKEWDLDLIIARNDEAIRTIDIAKDREQCCHLLKTVATNMAVKKHGLKAIMAGIRWDEQEARANEKYFSERKDHVRVHPLLHFTEKEIWRYLNENNVPHNPLYDKGYRSIGCRPCTKPTGDKGPERGGRSQDKEQIMAKLRALGYW
jgi:phosphoadenosine phosphosulfate reductase